MLITNIGPGTEQMLKKATHIAFNAVTGFGFLALLGAAALANRMRNK